MADTNGSHNSITSTSHSRVPMTTLRVLGVIGVAVLIFVGGFAGGSIYGKRHAGAKIARQNNFFAGGVAGTRRGGGMMRGGTAGGRVVGKVTNINGNSMTVQDSSGKNYTVNVSDSTSYYKTGAIGQQSDVKVDDTVLVSGAPDSSGNIAAQSVRIQ